MERNDIDDIILVLKTILECPSCDSCRQLAKQYLDMLAATKGVDGDSKKK